MEYALIFVLAIIAIAFVNKVFALEHQVEEVHAEIRRLRKELGRDESAPLADPAASTVNPPEQAAPVTASKATPDIRASLGNTPLPFTDVAHRVFVPQQLEQPSQALVSSVRTQVFWLGVLAVVMVAAALTLTGYVHTPYFRLALYAPVQVTAIMGVTLSLILITYHLHRHRSHWPQVRIFLAVLHIIISLLLLLAITLLTQWYLAGLRATAEMHLVTLSVVWGAFAVLLLGAGFGLRLSLVRMLAIALLVCIIIRTCYFYYGFFDDVYFKIATAGVLCVTLLVSYLLVTHFKNELLAPHPDERQPSAAPTADIGAVR